MNAKVKYWTTVIKNISIFLLSLVLIFILLKLAVFYMPFLIGFIISLIIEPLIRNLAQKTGITRKTSAIIVLIIIFSILIGLITWGIITLITESSNLLESINVYIEKIYNFIQKNILDFKIKELDLPVKVIEIAQNCVSKLLNSVTAFTTNFLTNTLQKVTLIPIAFIYILVSYLSLQKVTIIPIAIIYITITILSTYFICADKFYILDQVEHHVPRLWVKKFIKHLREISSALGNYLKAEMILILISFFIILIGLYIGKATGLKIEYPLLFALGIAFIDALPILGSGTVMIPWAIALFLDGNISLALLLIGLYIFTIVVRQMLEPKLISNKIGIHPIFTLIAMYTGFKLIGIVGLFLGPIILIILKNIFSTMIDEGILKSIFNRG